MLYRIFLILMLFWPALVQAQSEVLLPVKTGNRMGLIDTLGNIVVEPQFDNIEAVSGRPFLLIEQNGRRAAFNLSDKAIFTKYYETLELAYLDCFIAGNRAALGVINMGDSVVIPMKYESITPVLGEGYLCVGPDGIDMYSFIGELKSHVTAESAVFHQGVFVVESNGLYGIAAQSDKMIVPAEYNMYELGSGQIKLSSKDSIVVFHIASRRVINAEKDARLSFFQDAVNENASTPFYHIQSKSLSGFFSVWSDKPIAADLSGRKINQSLLSGYYYLVDSDYLLVDSLGTLAISHACDFIGHYRDRRFRLIENDLWGIYDLDSGYIIQPKYNNLSLLIDSTLGNQWFIAVDNEGYHLLREDGSSAIGRNLFNVRLYDGRGFVVSEIGKRVMLLGPDAKALTESIYDGIVPLSNRYWMVTINGKRGLLDSTGKVLLQPVFGDIRQAGQSIRCYSGSRMEVYVEEGGRLVQSVVYTNYQQLNLSNMSINSTMQNAAFTLTGPYRWRKDSTMNRFGLMSTPTGQWAIPPSFDYARFDRDKNLTLVGVFSDSAVISLGPLNFKGRMLFGIVDQERASILVPPVWSFIYFNNLLDRKLASDGINRISLTAANAVPAIYRGNEWGSVSYAGLIYHSSVNYIDRMTGAKAKAWVFDSAYVARQSKDYKICNVSSFFKGISSFYIPADAYTDSVLKAGKNLFLYAKVADSLAFQRSPGVRTDPGLQLQSVKGCPAFLYPWLYNSELESGRNFKNMLISKSERKYSFINTQGSLIHDLEFSKAFSFSEGLAQVRKGTRWGYIDTNGIMVIEPRFKTTFAFSEGKAAASIKGGKFGYIGKDGEWIIEPQFREALSFGSGLAPVKWTTLFGYIDENGKKVIDDTYIRASPFIGSNAVVYMKKGFGLIDLTGKWLLKPVYSSISPPDDNGFRIVMKGNRRSLVDQKGIRVVPYSRFVSYAGEGYYCVSKDKSRSLYNSEGEKVFQSKSDKPLTVSSGLILVTARNQYEFVDFNGKTKLGPFRRASDFNFGMAVISTNLKTCIIDTSGRELKSIFKYRVSDAETFDENGIAILRKSSLYYMIDTSGTVRFSSFQRPLKISGGMYVLSRGEKRYLYNAITDKQNQYSIWDNISNTSGGNYFLVQSNEWFGVADIHGRYYVKPSYTKIEFVQTGIYRVFYGDKMGYVKRDGTVLWEPSR